MSTNPHKPSRRPNPPAPEIPSPSTQQAAGGGVHWFGVENVATIQTRCYLETQIAVDYAYRYKTIDLVYGDAGLGKSFAARDALKPYEDNGVRVTKVEYPARTGMKGIASELIRKSTGILPSGDLRHVEQDLWPILAEHAGLVVVDETQRLNHEALEYLRHLHDDARTDFGLLLIGGHGCWEVISRYPMLESRILARVRVEPLTASETTTTMPGYHAVYAKAEPELLIRIHTVCTHGVFRSWAAFTRIAVDVCNRMKIDTITDEVVEIAFRLLQKGGQP